MRLDGKVAFVTGAAVGIGAGIAERFVEAGAAVALLDIDGEGARRHATHLQSKGTTLALQGDVAREEDVQQAIETAATQLGPSDILVNNAGIEISGNVSQLTSADWDRLLDVNLKGAFLCSKYAIPRMLGRGGVIINISSVRAFVSYEGGIAYDASKSGLIGFTRALALDHEAS